MPQLMVVDGKDIGATYSFNDFVMLGREENDGCVVLHDVKVSRSHAKIIRKNGRYLLTDLDSRNGTNVDGKIVKKVFLINKSKIKIGDTLLVFNHDSDRASAQPPVPLVEGITTIEASRAVNRRRLLDGTYYEDGLSEAEKRVKVLAAICRMSGAMCYTTVMEKLLIEIRDVLFDTFTQAETIVIALQEESMGRGKLISKLQSFRYEGEEERDAVAEGIALDEAMAVRSVETGKALLCSKSVGEKLQDESKPRLDLEEDEGESERTDLPAERDETGAAHGQAPTYAVRRKRTLMYAPLIADKKVVGVIQLGANDLEGEEFSQDDLDLFWGVCTEAALIISSAQMHTELLRQEELKRDLHRRMVQSEKLASLGVMISGVAEEFSNLLTVIIGETDFVLSKGSKVTEDAGSKDAICAARIAAERGMTVIDSLLNFARERKAGLERGNIIDALEETLKDVSEDLADRGIELSKEFDDAPEVDFDAEYMRHVFLNLLSNARDAMRGGGKLTVSVRSVDTQLEISFTDTGVGISAVNLDKVFDPFFTTKEKDREKGKKSYGLGLSIVYGIVKSHKGHISVESSLGRGSKFAVILPIPQEIRVVGDGETPSDELEIEHRGAQPGEAAYDARQDDLHILVIDDEELELSMIANTLRDRGHRVETVQEAETAIEKVGQVHYDLIMLDDRMPKKNGFEICEEIRELRSGADVNVVFMTAKPDEEFKEKLLRLGVSSYITKPFEVGELYELVERIGLSARLKIFEPAPDGDV